MSKCKVRSFSCPDYFEEGLRALAHNLSLPNGTAVVQHCIIAAFKSARAIPECDTAYRIFTQQRAVATLREEMTNEKAEVEESDPERNKGRKGPAED